MRKLVLYLHLCAAYAFPQVVSTATGSASIQSLTAVTIFPTPTPPPLPHHDLRRRDISSTLCGWVDGDFNQAITCDASATCLWNTQISLVGCGNATAFPSATACVDYTLASSANLNSGTQTCSASAPFCNTADFPNSYSMFHCSTAKEKRVSAALTYDGATTPIPLPRNIESGGKIAVETQTPVITSGTVVMTCSSSTASPTLVCNPVVKDTSNTASIIAAAVGGGVLLLGLPFGIKMILRKWKWRQEEAPPKQRKYPFVRQQVIEVDGPNFLFSQEWHGKKYEEPKKPPPAKEPKYKGPYMNT